MSAQDPSSAVFLSTSRDHPIHMWDLQSAAPRCSYAGYDHVDELDPAICVAFNPTGTRIYAGSNRMIRYAKKGIHTYIYLNYKYTHKRTYKQNAYLVNLSKHYTCMDTSI